MELGSGWQGERQKELSISIVRSVDAAYASLPLFPAAGFEEHFRSWRNRRVGCVDVHPQLIGLRGLRVEIRFIQVMAIDERGSGFRLGAPVQAAQWSGDDQYLPLA